MKLCRFVILILSFAIPSAQLYAADEVKPTDKEVKSTDKSPEEIVTEGIKQFREGMRSSDSKVREKAFDEFMVDKKMVETLFGDNGGKAWESLEEPMKLMRKSTAKLKTELDKNGSIKSIKLIDVRTNDQSGRYQRVLRKVPADIPIYRAEMVFENGNEGKSSSYLVIDGKMRFFQGLEIAADMIRFRPAGRVEQ